MTVFAHARRNVLGVLGVGDGNLGYITSLFFRYMYPDTKLIIFGTDKEKLSSFFLCG